MLILTIILFYSCQNKNPYKEAFEEIIKKNRELRQEQIDYQINLIHNYSLERPRQFKEIKIISNKLEGIFTGFFKKIINTDDINEIRIIKDTTLKELKKIKKGNFKIEEIIIELDKPITNNLDKLKCIDIMGNLYLETIKYLTSGVLDGECIMSTYKPTRVYTYRVNDSLVSINFANNIVKDYPSFFESKGRYLNFSLKDSNGNKTAFFEDDFIASYRVYTSSDTLKLKASIATKKNIGILISKDEKDIVVGQVSELKTNVTDFFQLTKNEK